MARRKKVPSKGDTPRLLTIVDEAIAIVRTARRNRCNLAGDNFYADKLARLRADATVEFQSLSAESAGDVSAMAEMLQAVFSPTTESKKRIQTARELTVAFRTSWKTSNSKTVSSNVSDTLFPPAILSATGRAYLISIGRQMNGSFSEGWYDAAAVMMRRLLENCIIEAFEHQGGASKIKDGKGDYFQLSDLIDAALREPRWNLSRNTKKYLPQLRDIGHMSAHGRYFNAKPDDIERIRPGARVAIEEFLHISELIKVV